MMMVVMMMMMMMMICTAFLVMFRILYNNTCLLVAGSPRGKRVEY